MYTLIFYLAEYVGWQDLYQKFFKNLKLLVQVNK